MYYFFKDTLQLDLAQVIFYNSILNFIWVLKPLFGFICDSYPLFRSHRKSYLVLSSVLNSVGWLIMAFCVTNLWQAMLTKTLINVAVSFENVIGEAIMVQTSRNKEQTSTNVSLYLSMSALSSIISQYLGGYLLTVFTVRELFVITSVLPLFNIIAALISREPVITVLPGTC